MSIFCPRQIGAPGGSVAAPRSGVALGAGLPVGLPADRLLRAPVGLPQGAHLALAGAQVVAVTSFFHSPLTEVAHLTLVCGSKETAFRVEAMASRLAHLTVLDALYVALAVRNRERTASALDSFGAVLSEHRF